MGCSVAKRGTSAEVAGVKVDDGSPQRMQVVYRFMVSPDVQAAAWRRDLRASNSVISA